MPGATPWGNELLFNEIGDNGSISLTGLPNGQFIAGWHYLDQFGLNAEFGIFDGYGGVVFSPFEAHLPAYQLAEPALAALSDGRYVAAWTETFATTNTTDVLTDIIDLTPVAVVPPSPVNTLHTLNNQRVPDVATLAGNAGYVIVYLDDEVSPGSIRGQMYNFAGQKIGTPEFFVGAAQSSPFNASAPHVAGLNNGGFVVTWFSLDPGTGHRDAFGQIFNANGQAVGGNFAIGHAQHSSQPDVAVLPDGRFVAVWTDDSHTLGDTDTDSVHGRIFNADGTPVGAEFLVNTQTQGAQLQPVIAALPDDRFVVAWYDLSGTLGDASVGAVHAQVFDTNGGKSGAEFLVNGITLYDQIPQSITTLADGRFVVAFTDGSWLSHYDNMYHPAARAQIFDPRETAVILPGTPLNDDFVGTAFGDSLHGAAGNDRLTGDAGNDALDGGPGADVMIGGAGNDVLDGGPDVDNMAGGPGDDAYYFDNVVDYAMENANEGIDTVYTSVNGVMLAANVENLVQQGSADLQGYGNALANVIYGNSGASSLLGLGGNDTIYGGAGNDGIDGGAGADTTFGGTGDDIYEVDDPGDVVIENANEGTDRVDSYVTWTLGANIENLVLYNATNINGTGNALVNRIDGNLGDNVLSGLGGDDQIFGYTGNDTLDGGTGADLMAGGTGNDAYYVDNAGDVVLDGDIGTDTVYATINYALPANVENLALQSAADLQGYGNALANTLFGNTGSNLLDGGAGADGMFGGAGNDTYFVDNSGDAAIENVNEGNDSVFATASFSLGANVENLILQGSADLQGYGNNLANTIYGNNGNNLLNGFAGVDLMAGGLGNDVYYADDPGDACFEVANQGNDSVFATCSYGLAADVEGLVLQGAGDLQAYGNNQANTIYGNSGNNLINAGGGIDLMAGGAGNDVYYVDDPSDACFEVAGQGNDAVFATCSYGLAADVETLILQGSANLQAYGNNQVNAIYGNAGSNLINGGGGADTMIGGAGDDVYFVDNAGDGIIENANEGNDSIFASVSFALGANIEGLVLQGGGNIGGTGNGLANSLVGNVANNTLDGGAGADQLTGNGGNDTFIFRPGEANGDVVVDFAGNGAAAGDTLQFIGYGAGATFTIINATHWQVNYNGGTSHDIIVFSNGAAIDPSDFQFI